MTASVIGVERIARCWRAIRNGRVLPRLKIHQTLNTTTPHPLPSHPSLLPTRANHSLLRYAVSPLDGFDNVLVVDNVPVVDASKKQKLFDRLRSTFAKAGAPLTGNTGEDGTYSDMEMPWDNEKGESKGYVTIHVDAGSVRAHSFGAVSYMFLTYPSADAATNALRVLHETMFGKNRLYVNRFGEIERFASMAIEEGETPKNWPADSEPTEKVSCGCEECGRIVCRWEFYRNTSDHGSPILKAVINSPLSETLPSRSTGAVETPSLNVRSNPTRNGRNYSSPGPRWEHTLRPCIEWVSPCGKENHSPSRIGSPTRECVW